MAQIHFLLVPDAAAARKVRRTVAGRGARLDVSIGTWAALADLAGKTFLVRESEKGWDKQVVEAAKKIPDAFWSKSLDVDPDGTMAEVRGMLHRLLRGMGPNLDCKKGKVKGISQRGQRRYDDLVRLQEALEGRLPEDLELIKAILDVPAGRAIRQVRVYRVEGLPEPDPWQQNLLDKLGLDPAGIPDPGLQTILESALAGPSPRGDGTALSFLQRNLFTESSEKARLDDSLLWLGVRDELEEMEVAAGMIQGMLSRDATLSPAQVALLLDGSRSRDQAAAEVFGRAGLPLSGLQAPAEERNLGGEAVFNFLVSCRPLPPAMSLAALVTSPLMPWPLEAGMRMAARLMQKRFELFPEVGFAPEARRMLELVRGRAETVPGLEAMLKAFAGLLPLEGGQESHARTARNAIDTILGRLAQERAGGEVPWNEILRMVPQSPAAPEASADFNREGIAVFYEGEESWRDVRVLFVSGFSENHYPATPSRSAVFDDPDIRALAAAGIRIENDSQATGRSRNLLLRQLRSASERCVFLVPSLDPLGRRLAVSGSAAFMARLFSGADDHEKLVLSLAREEAREKVRDIPLADEASPAAHAEKAGNDLQFGWDLFAGGDGTPRKETPTRLEKLMVSPLAWFLDRLDALPRRWEPEECDPITRGNVAHKVFERLFAVGSGVPDDGEIKRALPGLYARALQELAPFLNREEWSIERKKLEGDLVAAARTWGDILRIVGAEALGTELDLEGVFSGLDIKGKTDLVLKLAGGTMFIVDYKKSSATKRLASMKSGYDLQTSLYRLMIEEGTGPLAGLAAEEGKVGVMYYLMDSRQGLADMSFGHPAVRYVDTHVSENAERELRERIAEIRQGLVRLNREGDGERFDKVGVYVFCLKDSPLILKYALAGDVAGVEE